jgi:DNA-directed RNA polymerase specialized sigma24 family protein
LILGGNKWEQRRPQDYLIELPQFTWYWLHGSESKQEARKRILDAVAKIVDARLAEMEKAIKELPRVPTKSKPEHFTWTVLHQIRGVPLKDLAEHDGIALATVKNAVMGLKARLGIGLPKGRPKRKSYRPNTPGSPE